MIDADTLRTLERLEARALREGRNIWDVLDEAGLLVTEPRAAKIWAECLKETWTQVDAQPVAAFVQWGGGQNTPMDAVKGVLEFIDFFRTTRTGETS